MILQEFITIATILQRRRQFLIHSFLYYELNETIVSDADFNRWARDLIEYQERHPDLCADLPYHDLTKNLNTDYSAEAMGLTKDQYPLAIVNAALFTLYQHKKTKKPFKSFAEQYGYRME